MTLETDTLALRASMDDMAKLAGQQRLRIATLEAALRPFAQIAIQAEQAWTSGQYYEAEDYIRPSIRLKHFTAARAALSKGADNER